MLRKPREVITPLEDGGLALNHLVGVRVNPITRNMALTRFTGVNYMLMASRR